MRVLISVGSAARGRYNGTTPTAFLPRSLAVFRNTHRRWLAAWFAVLVAVPVTYAGNWPQWRGPTGDGISTEKNLPAEFDGTKNVVWKLSLPGASGATPAVWGNRIFL